ncbi:hypothetical protein Sme01_62520 [Sphaerisporangium melleum]|uniref:Exonuclease domain-containing protein n=1 Tax=Sphaerisporangium melleum TaxID=321316 RepID=A0A917R0F6_9ACTN|nr:3'-5' exonuclease [Sphaerisporangium melleum]GGK81985.1 hypothetical protein GCM10007964_25820 [Sphaerisporangium melleum]GII73776.1 hypothetical protein Sme01_62520 [Sphaerisporangium melleum]
MVGGTAGGVDLEGTGAQDRDNEAILEIGVASLVDGRPEGAGAYHSIVNPERHVMHRPWSPPGLTNEKPALGPRLRQILSESAVWLDGTWIVGHTVSVDWRLPSMRCPAIRPAALIDTLKPARAVRTGERRDRLSALLTHFGLVEAPTAL